MKTIVITGANSGIGKALAKEVISHGDRLIAICRDSDKSRQSYNEFLEQSKSNKPIMLFGDLTLNNDITRLIDELKLYTERIDLLINNAGMFSLAHKYSEEGIEMTLAINVLAMIRLTEGLIPHYPMMHIINVTSMMFKQGRIDEHIFEDSRTFDGAKRYSDSKLLVVYYTQWLSEKLDPNISAVAMHPGVVSTDVFREHQSPIIRFFNKFMQKPSTAAKRILKPFWNGTLKNGYYYNQHKAKKSLITYIDTQLQEIIMSYIRNNYL